MVKAFILRYWIILTVWLLLNTPLRHLARGQDRTNGILQGIQVILTICVGIAAGAMILVVLSHLPGWQGAAP